MAASRTDLPVHAPGTCGPSSPGAARSHRPLASPTRLRSASCNKANQQSTLLGSDSPSKKNILAQSRGRAEDGGITTGRKPFY